LWGFERYSLPAKTVYDRGHGGSQRKGRAEIFLAPDSEFFLVTFSVSLWCMIFAGTVQEPSCARRTGGDARSHTIQFVHNLQKKRTAPARTLKRDDPHAQGLIRL
jgi:hypothetical protein